MEAAGLASSIITFVELAAKILSRTREYLKDAKHAPENIRSIEVHLPLLAKSFEVVHRQARSRRLDPDISLELSKIVSNALSELQRLHHYVSMLKTDNTSTKLQRFDKAIKSVLKYDAKIDAALDKLRGYTDTLNFFHISVASGKDDVVLRYLKAIRNEHNDLRLQYDRDSMKKWVAGLGRDDYIDACISRRAPSTCEWIFRTDIYAEWQAFDFDKPDPKILWINAPPGYGKTFISASIFTKVEKVASAAAVFWTSESKFANSSLNEIPRSWVAQLLAKNAVNYEYVRPTWTDGKGDRASVEDIWQCLKAILASSVDAVTLVIDGLDEYQQQQARRDDLRQISHSQHLQYISIQEFLARLKAELRGLPCRFLCVSQSASEIRGELTRSKLLAEGFELVWEHIITQTDMTEDVLAYAKHFIDNKLPKKDDKLKHELADLVTQKAEGQMLWVALQEREPNYLRPSFSEKKCRKVIEDTPVGFEHIYQSNLDRIEQLGSDERARAIRVLNWTMHTLRPLSVLETVEAILIDEEEEADEFPDEDLPDDPNEEDVFGELRNLCGNFIAFEVDQRKKDPQFWKVRFTHSSVRVFLSKALALPKMSRSSHPKQEAASGIDGNSLLGRLCIRYLSYDNVWPPPESPDEPLAVCLPDHPLLTYAATYFPQHVTTENHDALEPALRDFILDHYTKFGTWQMTASQTKNLAEAGLANKGAWDWSDRLAFAASLRLERVCQEIRERDRSDIAMLSRALRAASWSGAVSIARSLIDHGAELESFKPKVGLMALHIAARRGQKEVVRLLLDRGADVDARNPVFGCTALHYAADWKQSVIVAMLLEASADPTIVDYNGAQPLYSAVYRQCRDIADLLLKNEEIRPSIIQRASDAGWFPLLLAVSKGDLDMTKCLLDMGADPTQIGVDGETPLFRSASRGALELSRLLINASIDAEKAINNITNVWGQSVLIAAVRGKSLELVQLLIESGADAACIDYEGSSALDWAAYLGASDILKYLLTQPRDDNKIASSWTPMHHACDGGFKEALQFLIDQGEDLTVTSWDGCTPLEFAAEGGFHELVSIIVAHPQGRTTINAICDDGQSPLLLACREGSFRSADILLDNGADVSVQNEEGFGALDLVARKGDLVFVKKLINRYGSATFSSQSILLMAAQSGNQEVFEILKSKYPIDFDSSYEGWTLLHCAAEGGSLEIVQDILQNGGSSLLTSINDEGASCLDIAASGGHVEIVKLFLQEYADHKPPLVVDGQTIVDSVSSNDVAILNLLHRADPSTFMQAKDRYGMSPLHRAIQEGVFDAVDFLLDQGFRVLDQSVFGNSGLHFYATDGHKLGQYFTEDDWRKGNMVRQDAGFTPLLLAAYCGKPAPFRRCLRYGASLTAQVDSSHSFSGALLQGYQSIHCAAYSQNVEIIKEIMAELGPDCLQAISHEGHLPVHAAVLGDGHYLVPFLFEQGVDLNVRTYSGETPLLLSIFYGSALPFLLEHGAASFEDNDGKILLEHAALNDRPEPIALLSKHFAVSKTHAESTLLHLAANAGYSTNIEMLLRYGLSWTVRDSHGWTARDCLHLTISRKTHRGGRLMRWASASMNQVNPTADWISTTWQAPSQWLFHESTATRFRSHQNKTIAQTRTTPDIKDLNGRAKPYVLTADHYFLPTVDASYFEVTVLACSPSSCLAIGVDVFVGERESHPLLTQLYYGDSGWFAAHAFDDCDMYGPRYGQGDTIGCGVDYRAGTLYFTKNGKCLGVAHNDVNLRLAPTLFTTEQDLKVKGNFGQEPFLFDPSKHGYGDVSCKKCYGRDGKPKLTYRTVPESEG